MHDYRVNSAVFFAKLLNFYPEASDEQFADMNLWFKKQARAFEVASLASKNPSATGISGTIASPSSASSTLV